MAEVKEAFLIHFPHTPLICGGQKKKGLLEIIQFVNRQQRRGVFFVFDIIVIFRLKSSCLLTWGRRKIWKTSLAGSCAELFPFYFIGVEELKVKLNIRDLFFLFIRVTAYSEIS